MALDRVCWAVLESFLHWALRDAVALRMGMEELSCWEGESAAAEGSDTAWGCLKGGKDWSHATKCPPVTSKGVEELCRALSHSLCCCVLH